MWEFGIVGYRPKGIGEFGILLKACNPFRDILIFGGQYVY